MEVLAGLGEGEEGEEEEEGEEGGKGEAGINILQKNLANFRAGKRVISSYPRKADRKTSKNPKMYYRVIFLTFPSKFG